MTNKEQLTDQHLHHTTEPAPAADALCAARRPKPPSLKQQALYQVESFACSMETLGMDVDTIRRALEALSDD